MNCMHTSPEGMMLPMQALRVTTAITTTTDTTATMPVLQVATHFCFCLKHP